MAFKLTRITVLKLCMAAAFAIWACVWILKPTKLWKRSWHGAEEWANTTFLGETAYRSFREFMALKLTRITVLKLCMAVAFAVWACVWILKPTKLWKRLWHGAEEWANTTFLGDTGLNVVVFCLPIIAVATLGYIYLHLCTEGSMSRYTPSNSYAKLIATLSNPVSVDAPIGILSGSELLVSALFIMFLAWTYYSNIASDFKKLAPYKSLMMNRWQLKVMHMGVRFGSLSEACLALLLLPVLRRMSLFRIFGVQFEASIRYHIWIGNLMILFSILHGCVIMFVWGVNNSLWTEITKWQRIGRVNLAGAISLAVSLIIWITSLPLIRRHYFQLFFSAHHLYMVFILFFLLHAGDRHFYLVFSGVLLFALDKILRIVQSRRAIHIISAQLLQCKAVEITLPKHPSTKYSPTSTIFLNVPSISKFQWHPFSIISRADTGDDRLSVLIKCQGQWTESFYEKVYSMLDTRSHKIKSLSVRVEGPYGPENFPYNWYDSLVLVAGGTGITPFLSIIQNIASRNAKMNTSPTKIQLVYMVKRCQDLSMLNPIIPLLLNIPAELGILKLKFFVTREDRSSNAAREILQENSQTKMVIMDPVSSAVGLPTPEDLRWIAALVGLSSFIFLAILVCLCHVFVPERKMPHKTETPSWVSDFLVICSFVIATSCATVTAVLLRWKKTVKEFNGFHQKQTKGREIHSVAEQGVVKEFEINYGKRPDLKVILSEFASKTVEPRVGVLVCGPDSMQRSVASFCKTYRGKVNGNGKRAFTYHSINFSL